jgi:hypothetical protein
VKDISSSNKIILLNQLMDEINNKLLRVRWENDPYEMYSVADQPSYGLPTDCTPDNVLHRVLVSQDISTDLSESTEWDIFEYAGILDKSNVDFGNYYIMQDDLIFLFKDGKPLQTTDLVIRLFYYRTPTNISSTSDTPEIEESYHNLLKYGLVQMVASIGDNPEGAIADYWQKKFDEELAVNKRNLEDKFDNAPLKTREIEERW